MEREGKLTGKYKQRDGGERECRGLLWCSWHRRERELRLEDFLESPSPCQGIWPGAFGRAYTFTVGVLAIS